MKSRDFWCITLMISQIISKSYIFSEQNLASHFFKYYLHFSVQQNQTSKRNHCTMPVFSTYAVSSRSAKTLRGVIKSIR